MTTHQNPLSDPTERGEWGIVSHPLENIHFQNILGSLVHGQFEVVEMPGLPPESSWAHYFKTGYAHEIRVCFENVKFLFSSTFQKKSKSRDFLCFLVFPCVSLCFPVFPCVPLCFTKIALITQSQTPEALNCPT